MSERRLVTKFVKNNVTAVDRISNMETMIGDAYATLGEQIEKFRLKSKGTIFDEKEARTLKLLVSSLVELSNEERSIQKSKEFEDLMANLSDEELLELAKTKLLKTK